MSELEIASVIEPADPIWSYFLGLFATDGSHSGDVGHKGKVAIELAERDRAVLDALHEALPVRSSVRTRTRSTNFSKKPRTTVVLSIFGQAFRRDLALFGYPPGPKARTVGNPTWEFRERDFLRGVIDGDGSVGHTRDGRPFISIATASERMYSFVRGAVGEEMWDLRNVNRNKRDGVFNVTFIGSRAADLAWWVYYPGALALPRKAEAALAIVRADPRLRDLGPCPD